MNSDRSCVSLRVRAASALSGDLGAFRGSVCVSCAEAGLLEEVSEAGRRWQSLWAGNCG